MLRIRFWAPLFPLHQFQIWVMAFALPLMLAPMFFLLALDVRGPVQPWLVAISCTLAFVPVLVLKVSNVRALRAFFALSRRRQDGFADLFDGGSLQ